MLLFQRCNDPKLSSYKLRNLLKDILAHYAPPHSHIATTVIKESLSVHCLRHTVRTKKIFLENMDLPSAYTSSTNDVRATITLHYITLH